MKITELPHGWPIDVHVRAHRSGWSVDPRGEMVNLVVWVRDVQASKVFVAKVGAVECEDFSESKPLTDEYRVPLGRGAAQELMDSLWDCGLRPSEGTGSTGQLSAVERHLKDMQRLVFEQHL